MEPPTRVVRHESEHGTWELVRRAPAPELRAFAIEYEGYTETGVPTPTVRQEVPTTKLPLIVNFGSAWEIAESAGGSRVVHDSFVAGLSDRSAYVTASGPASCVQVNVTPLVARVLFDLPMRELTNRVLPLDDVVPRAVRELPERLASAGSWKERFELVDAMLLRRLADARPPSRDVAWAWAVLERTNGRAPIGWICDRLGRSRRHLAARFREEIGLGPKTAARILRFGRAVTLLERGATSLGELAFECGYYDQAHMNRDFRAFADASPAAFARRIVPDGGVVLQ